MIASTSASPRGTNHTTTPPISTAAGAALAGPSSGNGATAWTPGLPPRSSSHDSCSEAPSMPSAATVREPNAPATVDSGGCTWDHAASSTTAGTRAAKVPAARSSSSTIGVRPPRRRPIASMPARSARGSTTETSPS
ncbi:MAG: hypothetical protein IPN32_37045 [Deltaproteobacteria bacterium]|nr:hypothetical protein [Deltaproteobacteria bacterium]